MREVLSVGQCYPDHALLRATIESHFAVRLRRVDTRAQALGLLRAGDPPALVLVNRKLDADYEDGLLLVRDIRAEARWAAIPVMLVSNYPEAQQAAVAAGAAPGFGKDQCLGREPLAVLVGLLPTRDAASV